MAEQQDKPPAPLLTQEKRKETERALRAGEVVQIIQGTPFIASKSARPDLQPDTSPAEWPARGEKPRRLQNPEDQATAEELFALRKTGDQLLGELTVEERQRYDDELSALERDSAKLRRGFGVERTTDEVRKTRALARERRQKRNRIKNLQHGKTKADAQRRSVLERKVLDSVRDGVKIESIVADHSAWRKKAQEEARARGADPKTAAAAARRAGWSRAQILRVITQARREGKLPPKNRGGKLVSSQS